MVLSLSKIILAQPKLEVGGCTRQNTLPNSIIACEETERLIIIIKKNLYLLSYNGGATYKAYTHNL